MRALTKTVFSPKRPGAVSSYAQDENSAALPYPADISNPLANVGLRRRMTMVKARLQHRNKLKTAPRQSPESLSKPPQAPTI